MLEMSTQVDLVKAMQELAKIAISFSNKDLLDNAVENKVSDVETTFLAMGVSTQTNASPSITASQYNDFIDKINEITKVFTDHADDAPRKKTEIERILSKQEISEIRTLLGKIDKEAHDLRMKAIDKTMEEVEKIGPSY